MNKLNDKLKVVTSDGVINWQLLASDAYINEGVTKVKTSAGKVKVSQHSTALTMGLIAHVRVALPDVDSMTDRDKRKVSKYMLTLTSQLAKKRIAQVNTVRLETVTSVIERVQGLALNAFDDTGLQAALLQALWHLYARIEIRGTDDSHWNESLPVDEYQSLNPNGKRGAQGFMFHNGTKGQDKGSFNAKQRIARFLPDSKYPDPLDQYALLSVTDKMTRGEPNIMVPIEYPKATKARLTSSPDSHRSHIAISRRRDMVPSAVGKRLTARQLASSKLHLPLVDEFAEPTNRVGIPLVERETKAETSKRINTASKAAIRLASERKAVAHSQALAQAERLVASDEARDRTILAARAILATI